MLAQKRIAVVTRVPPTLSRVRGYACRVNQVLANLLGYAIKFTPDGGRVTVSAEHVVSEESVRVVVSDTGAHISADALLRLFERFYHADNSATRNVSGTGLGLYVSKQIVVSLGGQIGVESALGQSSRFWFTLPLEVGG